MSFGPAQKLVSYLSKHLTKPQEVSFVCVKPVALNFLPSMPTQGTAALELGNVNAATAAAAAMAPAGANTNGSNMEVDPPTDKDLLNGLVTHLDHLEDLTWACGESWPTQKLTHHFTLHPSDPAYNPLGTG